MKSSRIRLNGTRVSLCIAVLAWSGGPVAHAAQGASTVPSPWVARDIGNPAVPGVTSFDQGTFTITASGTDIWGTSDQFHFLYQQVSGDVEIIARVDLISPADPWAKAGVMIRDSLAANSANAYARVTAGEGLAFQWRTESDGVGTYTDGEAATAPRWVRLVRLGTLVTAYSSANGTDWTTIDSATIPLGTTVYVGLAVTSHSEGVLTAADLSHVSVLPLSLPSLQTDVDIGEPAIAGSIGVRQGTYTIRAAGANIWSTSDQFHFVFQPVTGDVDIVARVASIDYVDQRSKAGVMIRESLAADSQHAFALISTGGGYGFRRRVGTGNFSVNTSGGAGAAPGWVRLLRTGSRFEAFRSTDGHTWTSMGSDTIPMADSVYVGLAVTSANTQWATTAVVDNVAITQLSAPPNQPPVVALTGPASATSFAAPANIAMSASASDPENRLVRVEFYSGTTRIGTSTTAPYSMTWSSVAAGIYSLTAVAYDADGATATSTAVTIDVRPNQAPSVVVTAPPAGTSYTAPATVTVSATASDPEGRLARVEFYAGGSLLGSTTTAPYSLTWASVAAGSYLLKAVAYDAEGASTASSAVTISVNTLASPPKQTVFQASADHFTAVTSYQLDIFANGANPDTATPVASSDLAKPTPDSSGTIAVDRSSFFAALVPGLYLATVSAIGPGGYSRSVPVTFER